MDLKSIDFTLLPPHPGIYKFIDKNRSIIYIGKAYCLKKRLRQYFFKKDDDDIKTKTIIDNAVDLEFTVVKNEYQALLLENELIKKHQPKFNLRLRDDKTYPYLKITKDEFPSLQITRKIKDDGGIYFGPYTSVRYLRKTLKALRGIFPLRDCKVNIKGKKGESPCLDYSLKICGGPCIGQVDKNEYKKLVKKVVIFLEGNYKKIILHLQKDMKKASTLWEFEKAKVLRDKIHSIEKIKMEEASRLEKYIYQEDLPKREINYEKVGNNLKKYLQLSSAPLIIEGMDISQSSGKYPTGAVVVFEKGVPNKNEYRKYKIKNDTRRDDYQMIKEVVERRYKRLLLENKRMPDLLIIDGGRGHLNSARLVLEKLGMSFDVISLAKEREGIFLKNRPSPLYLSEDAEELHLLQNIRNEAHRFARKYHLKLREK